MSCFNCFGDDSLAAVKRSKLSIKSKSGGGSIKSKTASRGMLSRLMWSGPDKSLAKKSMLPLLILLTAGWYVQPPPRK